MNPWKTASPPELAQRNLVVPISTDWTTLGQGGGIETFLKTFFENAADLGLSITVPCSGPREGRLGSVRFVPIMRQAPGEAAFTRRLRRALKTGVLRIPRDAVVLANEEHYAWAFRGMGLPTVLVSHGVIPEMLGMRHTRPFVWAYRFFIERNAVTNVDRVIAVNPEIQQYYLTRYPRQPPEKFVVVPVGIDIIELERRPRSPPFQGAAIPAGSSVVMFVGRLYPEKAPSLFISACDLVRQSGSVIEAIVVGDGIQADVVRDAIRSRAWLHWIPMMPHSEVLDAISASRALVVCSSYEAGPLVLLEAVGLGIPVVSTDVGRAREIVSGDLGRIVNGDAASVAAGIREVLSWEPERTDEAKSLIMPHLDFRQTMNALLSELDGVASK